MNGVAQGQRLGTGAVAPAVGRDGSQPEGPPWPSKRRLLWRNALLRDVNLSFSARVLGNFLEWYMNSEGTCYLLQATIATGLGLQPRQIRSLLAELKASAWLESTRRGPRSSFFKASFPEGWEGKDWQHIARLERHNTASQKGRQSTASL